MPLVTSGMKGALVLLLSIKITHLRWEIVAGNGGIRDWIK